MKQPRDRSLSDLHESLLHLILARLDVYSLPSCAQVCKAWSLIITRSPSFARLHASLHTSHTWFTLFSSPSNSSMVFYDTLATRCLSTRWLDLVDDPTSCVVLKQIRQILLDEELLATSEGLLLSMSGFTDFTVTNIVTRKKKLLPSPNPRLCHIAYVGMAYFWATMSYRILLCGLPQPPNPQGHLITCVYNSLTHCWTNATSTLSANFFVSCTRTCVWFDGHFYCVMGRALHLFNLETMEWGSVHHLPLHKGLNQPHDSMQVWLPSELIHFYCLWEHKGQLRLAGAVKNEKSKVVPQLWCLSRSIQNGCGMFQWKDGVRLPLIASKRSVMDPAFEGWHWYACGDTLCLCNTSKTSGWILEDVHFCVHDLAKGDLKIVMSIPAVDVRRDISVPAALAIQPCPFTSP